MNTIREEEEAEEHKSNGAGSDTGYFSNEGYDSLEEDFKKR